MGHEQEQTNGKRTTISEKSSLSFTLVLPLVAGVLTIAGFLWNIDYRLGQLQRSAPNVWTVQEQIEYNKILRLQNPALILPDVWDLHKSMRMDVNRGDN